jgi:hypothetical protein
MSRKITDLDIRIQPLVTKLLEESNKLTSPWLTFITDGFRTYEEQAKLYAQGRTTPGKIVTNAPPGTSNHEKGLAFDLSFQKDGKLDYNMDFYNLIVPIAKRLGFTWGGDWRPTPDYPHFEKLTFEDIIEKMNDQTKISKDLLNWNEDLEIQAIRGLLGDYKRLQLECSVTQPKPPTSPSTPTNDNPPVPSIETPQQPNLLSRFLIWVTKLLKELWNYD